MVLSNTQDGHKIFRPWVARQRSPRALRFAAWLISWFGHSLVFRPLATDARGMDRRLFDTLLAADLADDLFQNPYLAPELRDALLLHAADTAMRNPRTQARTLNPGLRDAFFANLARFLAHYGELFTGQAHLEVLRAVQAAASVHALREYQTLLWALLVDPRTEPEDLVDALGTPGIDFESLCYLAAEVPGMHRDIVEYIALRAIDEPRVSWAGEGSEAILPRRKRSPCVPLSVGRLTRMLPPGILMHPSALRSRRVRDVAYASAEPPVHVAALLAEPVENFAAAFRATAHTFPEAVADMLLQGRVGVQQMTSLSPAGIAPLLFVEDPDARARAILAIGNTSLARDSSIISVAPPTAA